MKTKVFALVGVGMIVLAMGSVPTLATEFRSGSRVFVADGTTVDDELYAFAQEVEVVGGVSGDLLASAGNVSIRGTVGQSASLAGGNVDVSGSVGNNLRAAGGQVRVSGVVSDNASVAGRTVVLSNTGRVGRDLQVVGGDLRIEGDVGRSLNVFGGEVSLDGKVGGDVQAEVGRLTVGPGAVIQGDLVYTSAQRARIAPGAEIQGKTVYRPAPKREKRAVSPVWKGALWVLSFLALFLVGVVTIALSPRGSEAAADRVGGAPWVSLLVGFILLVVAPVAAAVVMLTLIGIPLALLMLFGYLVVLYVGRVFVGLAIGRWLFRKFRRPQMSLYVDLLVGLLILWLLGAIPYVGWGVRVVALLLGLGALASQRYSLMRELRAEGRI